jgi:hypothetical protein
VSLNILYNIVVVSGSTVDFNTIKPVYLCVTSSFNTSIIEDLSYSPVSADYRVGRQRNIKSDSIQVAREPTPPFLYLSYPVTLIPFC